MTSPFQKIKLCINLVITLSACFISNIADAQKSPLWNTLVRGQYNVGFTVEWKKDYTRNWGQSGVVAGDYSPSLPYGRPVRISTWYPAVDNAKGKRMQMKDYVYIPASDADAIKAQSIITGKDIGDSSKSIKGLFSGNANEFAKFLNTSSEARMHAEYVKGKKFPLLVYSLGQNDYTLENIILFEYLASKGFVVICVPHLGVNPRKDYLLVDEPLSFDTQVRDMEFALSQSLALPFVDPTRIGTFGMSFGTIYSLLLAGRNRNIKAIVGLDGTVMGGLDGFAYKYWQSPFYDSANIKAPVLELFRPGHHDMSVMNSLLYSDRTLIEIKDLTHTDFTSYPMYTLHTPEAYLDTFAYARRTPAYAAKMFENICQYVSLFFDAHLNGNTQAFKNSKIFENRNFIKGFQCPDEEEFAKIILTEGTQPAIDWYQKNRKVYQGLNWLRQRKLNRMGYEMIYNNKITEAIKIFEFNVAVFPDNAAVYDSLGDAYRMAGQKKQAISNYEKSIALDPNNTSAKKTLDNLKSGN